MPKFNFDVPVERRGTNSLKFDSAAQNGKGDNLLSMWVADMDFRCPQVALDRIAARVQHGVFGYTNPGPDYYASVTAWMRRYGWVARPEWIVSTPGVVFALAMAVQAFTQPGDSVLIQQPVYYPFINVVTGNGRTLVNEPLVYEDGRYRIDFEKLEESVVANDVKLFLLCNPHNPVGRLWSRGELAELARICLANDVVVVSDEIHLDFVRPGHTHTVFATLGEDVARRCVVCTAASKTFNLAGLQASNIFIPDAGLRERFKATMGAQGVHRANVLGLEATQACYEGAAGWLSALREYLEANWACLVEMLREEAPRLYLVPAESTYLAWIDCRDVGLYGEDLRAFIEDEAGLWLDLGNMFGPEGDGFIRVNLATQRATVEQAIRQLGAAYRNRGF